MTFRTGWRAHRCKLDGCGGRAWRRCRVCERWVCRWHRFGSGHWFRCYQCPAEELREARRVWEEQEREERAAARAAREAPGSNHATPGPTTRQEASAARPGAVRRAGPELKHLRALVDSLR